MIDYDYGNGHFHFACAPRVGVSWFVKACQLSGLGPAFSHDHEPHDGTYRISLIRHPVQWLESVYAAKTVGWNNRFLGEFVALDIRQDLEAFVWQYLQEMPGEIGKLMLGFEADTILRIEDMPTAFIEFATGIGIDPIYFHNIQRMGRTNVNPLVVRMGKALSKQVIDAEKELCHEFGYY